MRIRLFVLLSIIKCVMGKFEGFIVGGNFAKSIKEFPHVAFLLLTSNDGKDFTCGSSILNQFILITAAHCVSDNIRKITASVGSVDNMKGKPYRVDFFDMHPGWDEFEVLNDAAVCKLKHQLVFGSSVKRVMVLRYPPKTLKGMIAGWGAVEENDYTFSNLLKYTDQRIWNYKKCQTALKSIVPRGTICGGERKAKSEFCSRGDSGSGLLTDNQILIGLVSFKYIAISRSLVVYTDVAYHYNWIKHAAEKLARVC